METTKPINRLKVVLVEQDRTGKWLAQAIGKNDTTVSRWCSNTTQPSVEALVQIARVLNVDVKDLLNSTK
jgi:transcriptional regulator with XRE-family HTH domain